MYIHVLSDIIYFIYLYIKLNLWGGGGRCNVHITPTPIYFSVYDMIMHFTEMHHTLWMTKHLLSTMSTDI